MTNDGHIHELSKATNAIWTYTDLTASALAPAVAPGTPIVGYSWEPTNSTHAFSAQHVTYMTANGLVYNIYRINTDSKPAWNKENLTKLAQSSTTADVAGSISASVLQSATGQYRVTFLATDGHIHQFVGKNDLWSDLDLTDLMSNLNIGSPASCTPIVSFAWNGNNEQDVVAILIAHGVLIDIQPAMIQDLYTSGPSSSSTWSYQGIARWAGW